MQILRSAPSPAPSKGLLRDDRGLSTVEYVILLVLIAVAGITVWDSFGDTVMGKVRSADESFEKLGDD